jgi:7-carboxy-7-deazaguanine synthase
MTPDGPTLRVAEIFDSLQGETTHAGRPAAFVRLAGCSLGCAWCDTPWAQDPEAGREMPLPRILEAARDLGRPLVVVTGGEPLEQAAAPALARALAAEGRTVLVETNGAWDIRPLAPPVRRILDLKPPSSGAADALHAPNLRELREGDEVKIVVADRADFDWAARRIREHDLAARAPVLLSPVAGALPPARIADWLLAERLPARLQLQLHRLLWPDRDRGA